MQAEPRKRSAEGAPKHPNIDEPEAGAPNDPNVDEPNIHAPNRPNVDEPNAGAPNRPSIDEKVLLRISKDVGRDWKQLAINMGFSTAENDGFEADNNSLVGQCHAMLVAWQRRQGSKEEGGRGLINALQEIGRMDLVHEHLPGDILSSSATNEAADRCQEELQNWYTSVEGYVQMLPWDDADKRPIGDMYSKLHLVKDVDGKSQGKEDDIIQREVESYGDLFGLKTKSNHLVKRVICEGQPGRGKTTLLDKIAYDWAEGNNEALKQFKLVFVLKLGVLSQDSDLMDAIFKQILPEDTGVDKPHLETFIRDNPNKVLVLMDGFDEFMTININTKETFGTVLKLLNRQIGRKCLVIVTTRPSHMATLTSATLIVKPFARVNVMGFTYKHVHEYVDRYYENEESKRRGLLDRIKSSSLLLELATSPMLLLFMCMLWEAPSALPETMSRLYLEGMKYIFKRKDIDESKVKNTIIELGKVALRGLDNPVQRLSFKDTEFGEHDLDIAIKAGILTRQRVRMGLGIANSIQFFHKTFQEYCAAKYCQDLFQNDPKIFLGTFANCNLESLEYLLRFSCGDNVNCTNAVLQLLVEKQMDLDKKRKLGLACFYESRSDALPSDAFLNVVFQRTLSLWDYGMDGMQSFLYLLEIAVKQNNDMLRTVESFIFKSVDTSSLTWVEVAKLMRGMPNLIRLLLSSNADLSHEDSGDEDSGDEDSGDEDRGDEAVTLSSMPNLNELELSGNYALVGKGAPWSQLKEMKNLQKLKLDDCLLTGDKLKVMAVSLSSMPNLTELDLSSNDDLGGNGAPWSQLKEMKHLQKLNLGDCFLTGDDLKDMAVPLSSMPNLTELDLSSNDDLGGNGAPWSQLKEMKHLQKLNLGDCFLTGDDLKDMAVPLSSMPNLTGLDLSSNDDLGGKGAPWSQLKEMKHLQTMDLLRCSLTGDDLKAMAVPLSSMPNLTELHLSFNEDLGGKGTPWSQLEEMQHLQKFNLESCSLTGGDLKAMAVPLSSMPNLTELHLSFNEDLGGKGAPWSQLEEMQHLQKFNLESCSLTGDDLKAMAVPLSSMPNLTKFDLSSNADLGGKGTSWSQLQEMKHLQKLALRFCSLTDDDLKAMAVPLSSMPILTELDLSENLHVHVTDETWPHFNKMKHLQKLILPGRILTGEDLKNKDMPSI